MQVPVSGLIGSISISSANPSTSPASLPDIARVQAFALRQLSGTDNNLTDPQEAQAATDVLKQEQGTIQSDSSSQSEKIHELEVLVLNVQSKFKALIEDVKNRQEQSSRSLASQQDAQRKQKDEFEVQQRAQANQIKALEAEKTEQESRMKIVLEENEAQKEKIRFLEVKIQEFGSQVSALTKANVDLEARKVPINLDPKVTSEASFTMSTLQETDWDSLLSDLVRPAEGRLFREEEVFFPQANPDNVFLLNPLQVKNVIPPRPISSHVIPQVKKAQRPANAPLTALPEQKRKPGRPPKNRGAESSRNQAPKERVRVLVSGSLNSIRPPNPTRLQHPLKKTYQIIGERLDL